MNVDDSQLDQHLRTLAHESLRLHADDVDIELELDSFQRRLTNGADDIRITSVHDVERSRRRSWLVVAAAASVVLAVGLSSKITTRDTGPDAAAPSSSGPTTMNEGPSTPAINPPSSDPTTTQQGSTPATATDPSAAAPPSGDATPSATAQKPAYSIGGGFDLLAYPKVGFAGTAADLTTLLAGSTTPVDVEGLGVDWSTFAVVVFVRPTDLCPSVFVDVTIEAGVLRPLLANPGYTGCEQPLLSHTIIAAVDRSLLADVDRIELPAEPPYFETPVSVPVSATPASGQSVLPASAPVEFGVPRGSADLPPRGEATLATLDDGSPVIVVRHHDDSVSAIDPRAYAGEQQAILLVAWTGKTRTFLGRGAWDEFGRRLDGFRNTDLITFATRITGQRVEIGDVTATPQGSPIGQTSDPSTASNLQISPENPISVTEAVELQPGDTRWVDAQVVIDPAGAHVCGGAEFQVSSGLAPCPNGSPLVDNIIATDGLRTVWFGPLLVTRTETGFDRIVATGGNAASSSGEGLPPPGSS